jgi:pimeloyl-ACP methyl ester carboxylesterase
MANVAPPVDLVDIRTSDGLTLTGALAVPATPADTPRFDAVLMMHGAAARFYDTFYDNFSAALVRRGVATLRANNRGHDIVNRGNARGALAGVALEDIADCAIDWSAWLDFLNARGYKRILLFGHSLGAVKSAYYLATHADQRVTGCVLASPPRFNTERMLASDRGPEFAATIAAAQALVDAGAPDDFVRTTFPLKSFAGAAAYLAKYATGTTYDVFEHLPAIACPVLGITGSEELGDATFIDAPAEFAAAKRKKPDIEFVLVPDGDHHYSRAQTFVVERFLAWIDAGNPA